MPKQIFDSKTFKSLIPRAEEVRVVRSEGKVKLKLRTKGMLYTDVSDDSEAEKLLKNVDKPVVEVNPKTGKEKAAPKKKSGEEEKEADAEEQGDGEPR